MPCLPPFQLCVDFLQVGLSFLKHTYLYCKCTNLCHNSNIFCKVSQDFMLNLCKNTYFFLKIMIFSHKTSLKQQAYFTFYPLT